MAVDNISGTLYVADNNNNRVRNVSASTALVQTVAGNGTAAESEGAALLAAMNMPMGVAVSSSGAVVYVTDYTSGRIRKISGGVSTRLSGSVNGFADGAGSSVRCHSARCIRRGDAALTFFCILIPLLRRLASSGRTACAPTM